ncbi:crossover junction endodeoxyribonuclease RuvC [Candidatus Woesebacteria bacterium]|nr:crossover junction endodeoxyribonuclease RuvC [Candidatus Woesebacteria bacterium]
MVVISFDSGLERTGYAVFTLENGAYDLKSYGCLFTSAKESTEKRIHSLHLQVEELIKNNKPDAFVLERLFFSVNKKTAIVVAQAQGSVLQLAGMYDITVDFLTPNEIKQSMTGYGNADKKSVQKMVMLTLGLDVAPEPDDTADAIACGLTYCTMKALYDRQT